MRTGALILLLLAGCGSGGQEAQETRALDARLRAVTIDGRPAPPKRTPDRLPAIPDQLRGRWSASRDCGAGSPGVLTVGRDSLRHGGTAAAARYILRAGEREVSIELGDAGLDWPRTTTLLRQADGRLRRADPDGEQRLYRRCPSVTG